MSKISSSYLVNHKIDDRFFFAVEPLKL